MNTKHQYSSVPAPSEEEKKIWTILEGINDPEVPVLSILDLGIVRNIILYRNTPLGDGGIEVVITPTYSGCPAIDNHEYQNGITCKWF